MSIDVTFPNRLGGPEYEKCSRYHQNPIEIGFVFRFDPIGGGGGPPKEI